MTPTEDRLKDWRERAKEYSTNSDPEVAHGAFDGLLLEIIAELFENTEKWYA